MRQGRAGLKEERGPTAEVKVGQLRLSGVCEWYPQGQEGEKAEKKREDGPSGTILCELCNRGSEEPGKDPVSAILMFSHHASQPGSKRADDWPGLLQGQGERPGGRSHWGEEASWHYCHHQPHRSSPMGAARHFYKAYFTEKGPEGHTG